MPITMKLHRIVVKVMLEIYVKYFFCFNTFTKIAISTN